MKVGVEHRVRSIVLSFNKWVESLSPVPLNQASRGYPGFFRAVEFDKNPGTNFGVD